MANKTNLNITLDKDLIKLIDTDRGQTPRSSFINWILLKFFKETHEAFNWNEEHHLAEEDIKAGKIKKFSNKNEAMKWLKN